MGQLVVALFPVRRDAFPQSTELQPALALVAREGQTLKRLERNGLVQPSVIASKRNDHCHEFAVQDSQSREVERLTPSLHVLEFTGVRGEDPAQIQWEHAIHYIMLRI